MISQHAVLDVTTMLAMMMDSVHVNVLNWANLVASESVAVFKTNKKKDNISPQKLTLQQNNCERINLERMFRAVAFCLIHTN